MIKSDIVPLDQRVKLFISEQEVNDIQKKKQRIFFDPTSITADKALTVMISCL